MVYIIDYASKTVKRVNFGGPEMMAARNVYMTRDEAQEALNRELLQS